MNQFKAQDNSQNPSESIVGSTVLGTIGLIFKFSVSVLKRTSFNKSNSGREVRENGKERESVSTRHVQIEQRVVEEREEEEEEEEVLGGGVTRVLLRSAFSSEISSSLSRSCSRHTFSSLVNTANSCKRRLIRHWDTQS